MHLLQLELVVGEKRERPVLPLDRALAAFEVKRVPISRVIPASALSTSARSIRETMSKLGTVASAKDREDPI
jgi:hypothetical protein